MGKAKKEQKTLFDFERSTERVGEEVKLESGDKYYDKREISPFDIPKNWIWTKLSDLTTEKTLNDGNWVLSKDMVSTGPVKLIQLGSIGDCQYIGKGFKYLTKKRFDELRGKQIYSGYLLVNRLIGDKMLSCIIPDLDGILMTAVDICWIAPNDRLYNIKYLMFLLASEYFQEKVRRLGRGSTRFRISKLNLINIAFPLPPLAEQARIVSLIESLFSRLDEARAKAREVIDGFELWKSAILHKAFTGRLVEQRPEEGTGEELFREIQAEKQRFVKEGKIKKEKPLPEIKEDEIPFEIPEGWKWVRWGELSESIQYGYNAPAKQTGRIKMVRISDIHENVVNWANVPYCDIDEEEIPTYLLRPNDILFARTGGTVGKSFLVLTMSEEAVYAGYLIRTRYSILLCPQYLKFFMDSQLYWTQLREGTIATAQPNCNGKTLAQMILPLPPLSEQKRIVSQIESLFSRMEEAVGKAKAVVEQIDAIKKSILEKAFRGELGTNDPTEESALALLKSVD